ncbi:hypothetical protein NNJEOMEG_01556 [Fundidesulfovibrio magnetotacticus]|uniref:Flagellar protein FlaG n=1 Tax=Fundidesulfovibrio magnetotacticus TaxID=2730080 RepID=A0A6V8LM21_9BACT|nr:flagellar protein FlaG [Fundidesulfovibrio magnetotacticus]GFK93722.1 hypothetical protein NNJEOMEG_01556 [Fundidesulfovibrio magnetotacticus]
MNIQNIETPKEAAHHVDAEKAVQALKVREEAVRQTEESPREGQGQDQHAQERDPARDLAEREKLLAQTQDYFHQRGVDLHFKVLDETGQLQVEMKEAGGTRVIRKIPQDEIVKLSDNLKRMAKGLLDKSV